MSVLTYAEIRRLEPASGSHFNQNIFEIASIFVEERVP